MKTKVIVPAVLSTVPDPTGQHTDVPYAALFEDVYHSASGAQEQAEHVFLNGNDLPRRWQGCSRFVILETGFGLGNNFLATWACWRQDPMRSERLIFVSIEKHPLTKVDLARTHTRSPQPELAQALIDNWPQLTPNLHTLTFDDGRVQLLLGFGDIKDLLPALSAEVDAFYLDGFSPKKNPDMWSAHLFKRLAKLAAPKATVATWSFARLVRDGLSNAGFKVERAPGFGGKRDMLTARYEPRYVPIRPPGAPRTPQCERKALIIGAGLAGCAAAWALAEQGWRATVLDSCARPAKQASGNPAGLFHGIINGDDGVHSRLHRAAALTTARLLRPWIDQGRIPGQCHGLLRLEPRLTSHQAEALLEKLGLPNNYVSWLDQAAAEDLSGLPVPSGGWLFGDGGWVNPASYARALLNDSGATFIGDRRVDKLSRVNGLWCAWGVTGELLAQAPAAVIACGHRTAELLPAAQASQIQLASVRGQISWLNADMLGPRLPAIPVAGAGYAIHTNDGRLIFGASAQEEDHGPAVRRSDHQHNLDQARRLGALSQNEVLEPDFDKLGGRVGWRAVTRDRLPIIGPVAASIGEETDAIPKRADHPRHYRRQQDDAGGLYVLGGLGSRGITWAALAGRVLAAWITGSPAPIEADIMYAMDPTRFVLKGSK